jgi:hypothetical protein
MVPAAFVGAMFIYYELGLALGDLGFVLISLVSIGAGVDTFSLRSESCASICQLRLLGAASARMNYATSFQKPIVCAIDGLSFG